MNIVFMGTPEFAVPSLAILLQHDYHVLAVVTAPDRPAGRGQRLQQSAVKQFALSKNIPVLEPLKMKDPDFIAQLKNLQPDLQIVVAFRMLPELVWGLPPLGTFNLHASLLPQYRGAAPINWALMNGEKETGATTFFLNHEIDKGSILFTKRTALSDTENAGELHDRLMHIGAELVLKTVKAIEKMEITPQEQQSSAGEQLKEAPKIFKEDCRINWHLPVRVLYNKVRGLSPYPTAFTELNGLQLKVFKSSVIEDNGPQGPTAPSASELHLNSQKDQCGHFVSDGRSYLRFRAADGFLELLEVQIESKKRMPIEEFLKGYRIDTIAHNV